MMPNGMSLAGFFVFLGGCRHRIEADVAEKYDRCRRADAWEPVRREATGGGIVPVVRLDQEHADGDEKQDDTDLEQHHRVVRVGRLLDPDHQNDRDRHHDQKRRQVDDDRKAENVRRVAPRGGDVLLERIRRRGAECGERRMRRSIISRQPCRDAQSEVAKELAEVSRPPDGHTDVAHRVFDDQIPPDDPGDELADTRVRVRVCGPGDRHHRRELGIAQRSESAGNGSQKKRENDRRSRSGTQRVSDNRRARGGKDPCSDRGPHPQRGEMPLVQRPFQPAPAFDIGLAVGYRLPDEQRRLHQRFAAPARLGSACSRCACRRTTDTRKWRR